MRPITKWILAVAVANALLLPVTFAPARNAAVPPQAASLRYDCCREAAGRASYCCHKCCWRRSNCSKCLGALRR